MTKARRTFGTTRREKSGRYSGRYSFDGRQVSVPGTFPTKKAARKPHWPRSGQTDLGLGTHVDPVLAQGTVGAFWAEYRSEKTDWSPTSPTRTWESVWKLHVGPTFDKLSLGQVTQSKVRSWHATLHKDHPPTAQSAYRLLRQVLHAAVEDGTRLSSNSLPGERCRSRPLSRASDSHPGRGRE